MSVADSAPIDYEDDELDEQVSVYCPYCRNEPDAKHVESAGMCSYCDASLGLNPARIAAAAYNNESPQILLTGNPGEFEYGVYDERSADKWSRIGVAFWVNYIEAEEDTASFYFPKAMIGLCADRAWEEF